MMQQERILGGRTLAYTSNTVKRIKTFECPIFLIDLSIFFKSPSIYLPLITYHTKSISVAACEHSIHGRDHAPNRSPGRI
jgi:hypothetical protein